jgi:hypothetical protein
MNVIWPTLRGLHRSYVWRVRISSTTSSYSAHRCLAGMHKPGQRCADLIYKTANALSSSVVTLMLLAVQKDNLQVNIYQAVKW